MMKGQMFVIAALIMIVAIIGLKTSLSLQGVVESQRHLTAGLDILEFNNIRSEMIRVLQNSFPFPTNMTNNLNNFDSFVQDVLSSKTVEFDSLLVENYYPTLGASTDTTLVVTVYNSLGADMIYLNLTLNGNTQTFSLTNRNALAASFTVNTPASMNETLTVLYVTSSATQTENITIPFTIGSSKYVTFFDIKYITGSAQQSDKFVNTINLS